MSITPSAPGEPPQDFRNGMASAALVWGILGFLFCAPAGLVGAILGSIAWVRAAADVPLRRGRRKAIAGVCCGISSLVVMGPGLYYGLYRAREVYVGRNICAANLASIGKALQLYASENAGFFPVAPYKTMPETVTDNTHAVDWVGNMARDLNRGDQRSGLDIGQIHPSRSVFLLIIDGSCTSLSFTCPSSDDDFDDMRNYEGGTVTAGQPGTNRFDFTGYRNLSYGYQLPFGPKGRPTALMDAQMPLMADKGPFFTAGKTSPNNQTTPDAYAPRAGGGVWAGGDEIGLTGIANTDATAVLKARDRAWRPFNSRNHGLDGQNVLFADGHVSFERTPIVGVDHDNIYTMQGGDALVQVLLGVVPRDRKGPWTNTDSIIVP